MEFLFSTGSLWSYSVERSFRFAAASGFDGIELMIDPRWETRQPAVVRAFTETHGILVQAVHSPFMPHVPGWPEDQPGRILESIRLAEEMGARIVVHHLPTRVGIAWLMWSGRMVPLPIPRNPDAAYRAWLEGPYQEVARQTSVKLCIENLPAFRKLGRRWNYAHWNTLEEIVRFPAITLDTTHLGTWGLDPASCYPLLDGRVAHVHLSNYDGREHRRPETGHLRLDRFLARLVTDGYDGAVTLELEPSALDAGGPDDQVIGRMTESLRLCREWAAAGMAASR
jgi:sugar phosphate isomerase/epimerase